MAQITGNNFNNNIKGIFYYKKILSRRGFFATLPNLPYTPNNTLVIAISISLFQYWNIKA